MDRKTHTRLASALLIIWIALLLIVILAACGSGDPETPMADRFTLGRLPTLIAEDAPPCQFPAWAPYYNLRALCAEMVYDSVTPPEAVPALASITFGADGTLYMVRTAHGEIWALRDPDGDLFLDDLVRVAGGLRLPTGIAAHEGALYVVSMDGIARLDDPDGDGIFDAQTVLVDDLPGAAGGDSVGDFGAWPASIAVGPDERLYVSIRAAGEVERSEGEGITRREDAALPGLLASYALDGSDEQIVATGFHDPADFAWHPDTGDLWLLDRGEPRPDIHDLATPGAPRDELNRISANATPGGDYGYPDCYEYGESADQDILNRADCDDTLDPDFVFGGRETNSAGIAFYASDAIPFWTGSLLVAQRGSWSQPAPEGYAVMVVPFDEDDNPTLPLDRVAPRDTYARSYDAVSNLSLLGQGFFPYHPVDVAVSAEGWIYIALEEGRILRFRPRPKANEAMGLYTPGAEDFRK